MQIATSRHASAAVNPTSSPPASDGLDRSYSIVESTDIYASRPNRSYVPSLIYHNNAMTINKYVEAERRTIPGPPYKRRLLFRFAIACSSENPQIGEDVGRPGDLLWRGQFGRRPWSAPGPDAAAKRAKR